MTQFIKGMDLCEGFFSDIVKPILDKSFPHLRYSAGLIGYGSDVLGYDDSVSSDHMWGPRLYLFLLKEDMLQKEKLMDTFSGELPYFYKGYSVNFSVPDPNDGGIRHAEAISQGPVSPLIFIRTLDDYLEEYLGCSDFDNLTELDWISFSQHKLLSLTAGRLFWDDLHCGEKLQKLSYYPDNVRLFLLASNWSLLSEEQAYVRRCHDVGDEIGSFFACTRIAQRLMHLGFLYCNIYAPYSKWFGTAFGALPIGDEIKAAIYGAVTAADIEQREENIVAAQLLMAQLHNRSQLTDPVEVKIQPYFTRDIKVIYADRIAAAIKEKLKGTALEDFPLIGTLGDVANFTAVTDDPAWRQSIKRLYLR